MKLEESRKGPSSSNSTRAKVDNIGGADVGGNTTSATSIASTLSGFSTDTPVSRDVQQQYVAASPAQPVVHAIAPSSRQRRAQKFAKKKTNHLRGLHALTTSSVSSNTASKPCVVTDDRYSRIREQEIQQSMNVFQQLHQSPPPKTEEERTRHETIQKQRRISDNSATLLIRNGAYTSSPQEGNISMRPQPPYQKQQTHKNRRVPEKKRSSRSSLAQLTSKAAANALTKQYQQPNAEKKQPPRHFFLKTSNTEALVTTTAIIGNYIQPTPASPPPCNTDPHPNPATNANASTMPYSLPKPPTEAQLRWSQFQTRKRAKRIQSILLRLYSTPANWWDVSNATKSDASLHEGSNNNICFTSSGYRAFLAVSQRLYLHRKRTHIMKWKIGEMNHKSEEEQRRFEEAFRMMIASLKPLQAPEIEWDGIRRWHRDDDAAVGVYVDGDTSQPKSQQLYGPIFAGANYDRSDVNLPLSLPNEGSSMSPPRANSFSELVESMQKNSILSDNSNVKSNMTPIRLALMDGGISKTFSSSVSLDKRGTEDHFRGLEIKTNLFQTTEKEHDTEIAIDNYEMKVDDLSSFKEASGNRITESNLRARASAVAATTNSNYIHLSVEALQRLPPAQNIIDTDVIGDEENYGIRLSPDVLNKRLMQAMRAVQEEKWESVSYLLSANHWLAEMAHPSTSCLLLHTLSFYGCGKAPVEVFTLLLQKNPTAVHRLDASGNLPLHMACMNCAPSDLFKENRNGIEDCEISSSSHILKLLGEAFTSAASVQNGNGDLPLHLCVRGCGGDAQCVALVRGLFQQGVRVRDASGNLPLHLAVLLDGYEDGVAVSAAAAADVCRVLLCNNDNETQEDDDTQSICANGNDASLVLATNAEGWTPLMFAIHCGAGWEVVDALLSAPGGEGAAFLAPPSSFLSGDNCYGCSNCTNALHMALSMTDSPSDPAAILSLLKHVPRTAAMENSEGLLPIELAFRNCKPPEVILAILLADLPISLDCNDNIKEGSHKNKDYKKEGKKSGGESWWYICCNSDDAHINVVCEVLSLCSYSQAQELCFYRSSCTSKKVGNKKRGGGSVITRASKRCKIELRKSLRFVGRYEFEGSKAMLIDEEKGLKVFEALDFGYNNKQKERINCKDGLISHEDEEKEGQRVLLRCFSSAEHYEHEVAIVVRNGSLDTKFVETWYHFSVHEFEAYSVSDTPQQFVISVEQPKMKLLKVVQSAPVGLTLRSERRDELTVDDTNIDFMQHYLVKVRIILRSIGQCLCHIHERGIIHGAVNLTSCGSFVGKKWKLTDLVGARSINSHFLPDRMGIYPPPESVEISGNTNEEKFDQYLNLNAPAQDKNILMTSHFFVSSLPAHVSIDIWSFGVLIYETLVRESFRSLFDQGNQKSQKLLSSLTYDAKDDNQTFMARLFHWNEEDLREVVDRLMEDGFGPLCADLVSHCLCTSPNDRPSSMEEVLEHPFFNECKTF